MKIKSKTTYFGKQKKLNYRKNATVTCNTRASFKMNYRSKKRIRQIQKSRNAQGISAFNIMILPIAIICRISQQRG